MTSTDNDIELDRIFEEAMIARDAGDFEKAKFLCLDIIAKLGDTDRRFLAVTHCQLGWIHYQVGELPHAEHHYRLSVHYAPKAELASLGLFHAYVKQDRWREAMEEAIRYLCLRDSAEYRSVFEFEGFGDDFEGPVADLLAEALRLLAEWRQRN